MNKQEAQNRKYVKDIKSQAAKANRFLGQVYDKGFDLGGFMSNDMKKIVGPTVALVPRAVMEAWFKKDPTYWETLMKDDDEWEKFLKRNPEYKVDTRKRWDIRQ